MICVARIPVFGWSSVAFAQRHRNRILGVERHVVDDRDSSVADRPALASHSSCMNLVLRALFVRFLQRGATSSITSTPAPRHYSRERLCVIGQEVKLNEGTTTGEFGHENLRSQRVSSRHRTKRTVFVPRDGVVPSLKETVIRTVASRTTLCPRHAGAIKTA